jgi:hypothetical protein
MVRNILIAAAALMLWSSSASAQGLLAGRACAADIKKYCAGVEPGQGRIGACVKEHLKDLSEPCRARLARFAEAGKACAPDVKEHCGGVRPGRGRVADCLKSLLANVSDACKDSVVQAVVRRR